MFKSHALGQFWPKAIATFNHLTNCRPTKKLTYKTPLNSLGSFVSIPTTHSSYNMSLDAWCMFIFQKRIETNYNP